MSDLVWFDILYLMVVADGVNARMFDPTIIIIINIMCTIDNIVN